MKKDKDHIRRGIVTNYDKKHRLSKSRKCIIKDCNDYAIDCHILQKNGIISRIRDQKQQIYSLAFSRTKEKYFFFDRVHYKDCYTFRGLCSHHDTNLFKDIEKTNLLDFYDYKVQLRFSIRALMNFFVDNRIDNDVVMSLMKDEHIKQIEDPTYRITQVYANARHLHKFRDQGELMFFDLKQAHSQNFIFYTIELPKIDICCSQIYVYEKREDIFLRRMRNLSDITPSVFFVNVLSLDDKSILMIGYDKRASIDCKNYVDHYKSSTTDQILFGLNELLLRNANLWLQPSTWLCSTKFYEDYIKSSEDIIIDIMYQYYKLQTRDNKIYTEEEKQHQFNCLNDPDYLANFYQPLSFNIFNKQQNL